MELRHLRYFVAVAEAEHFGQAASALGVSQPALSQRVADLERELGVELFERLPRGVRLSAAGRVFLEAAREAIAVAAAGAERARDVGRGITGRVTVGLPETAADAARVRRALAALQAERPSVAVVASGLPWLEQVAAVLDGRLDAGFAWSPDSQREFPDRAPSGEGRSGWHPAGLASVRAYDDPVDHVLIPADHPLAVHSHDRPVTPAELRAVPFGLFARTLHPRLYDALCATLITAGALDSDQLIAAAGMAMAGVATVGAGAPLLIATGRWTFVPHTVAADPPSGIESRRIAGVAMWGGFDVVWRADDRRPLLAALVEALRSATSGAS